MADRTHEKIGESTTKLERQIRRVEEQLSQKANA